MYRLFAGIDVSKDYVDASWTDGPNPTYLGRFENSIAGFKKLVGGLKAVTSLKKTEWFICFENTGTYSKLLFQWLCSQGIACREENAMRILKEAGVRRGKSDKIDSIRICLYAFKNRDILQATPLPSPESQLLKKLLSRRDFLVRQRVARQVSLREQKSEFPTKLLKQLEEQDQAAILKLNEDIEFIEDQIDTLIAENNAMQKNYELAQSVKGVGPVITWYLIAYTGNFENFANARKFASYCGVAPFPYESGSSQKYKDRVSPLANKHIKALITNGALAAIAHDTEIRSYAHRKLAEGKEPGCVQNAVKNKLIARVFAVVKRGTPFVATHNYA